MDAALITGLLQSTLAMSVPLLLAAQGELIAEKAGVINIGLEGMMLSGALAAMATVYFGGSPLLGVPAAWIAGLLLAAVFGYVAIERGGNQVVAGIAVNLLAVGMTGVAYRSLFGVTGAALTVAGVEPVAIPWLSSMPIVGPSLFRQTLFGYLAFLLAPLIGFALYRTLPGLRLRMVGESPAAAIAHGVNPRLVQAGALVCCGLLAATAGAYLAVAYARTFVEGMSAGRGFIALAIVIFGRWSLRGTVAGSLLFGLATALQFHVQALGLPIPYQFALMMPYVLTLLVLAVHGGGGAAPAHLGAALDSKE